MDDDDSLKEEIKKLETELAEIKADEADDTWTEKVTISCSALVDCPCKDIGRHSPLRPLRVVCVFKAGLFDKLLDKYQGFSLELSWIGPNLDSCERSFNRINSRAWGLVTVTLQLVVTDLHLSSLRLASTDLKRRTRLG